MERSVIVKHVREGRSRIILTLVLLFVAAFELFVLGSPDWQYYVLLLLAIPVIFVLVYYRK